MCATNDGKGVTRAPSKGSLDTLAEAASQVRRPPDGSGAVQSSTQGSAPAAANDDQFLFSRLKRFQGESEDPHDHFSCTHGEISRENGYIFFCEIPTGCPHQWQKQDSRGCISDFFGRNKRCTRAIKRQIFWCRSHYQTNAYQDESWKYQRLGLIQEQACRIEEDSGARYTICLKNEGAERLNNWVINGEDLPAKTVKHKRGQSFRSPVWALRYIENKWVGTDKTLDDVIEFVAWTNHLIRTGRLADIPKVEFLPQFENVKITLQKAQKDSIARAMRREPDATDVDILAIAEEAEMVESGTDYGYDGDDDDDRGGSEDGNDTEDEPNTGDVEMADADHDSDATISMAGSPEHGIWNLHSGPGTPANRKAGGSSPNAHDARLFNPINGPRSSSPPSIPLRRAAPPSPLLRNVAIINSTAQGPPAAALQGPQQPSSSSSSASAAAAAATADRDRQLMLLDQHYRSCDLQLTAAAHMALGARNAVQLANVALDHPVVAALNQSLSLIQQVRESVVQQQRHREPLSRAEAHSGRVQKP